MASAAIAATRGGDAGGGRVVDAEPLGAQEGDHEQREQRAAEELGLEVEHDGRDDVEREQQQQRERREAGATAAAGPEGEQPGEDDQQRPAHPDHRARPLVEPAVRDAHAGQRVDPAPRAGHQVAPAVGPQVLVAEPAGEQRGTDGDQRHGGRGDLAPPAGQPRGEQQRRDEQHDDPDRLPRPPPGGGLDQVHPLQPREQREDAEEEPADPAERQRGAARGGGAQRGDRRAGRERAQAAPPTAAMTAPLPVRPATKPWQPATSSTGLRPAIAPGTTSRQPPGVRPSPRGGRSITRAAT